MRVRRTYRTTDGTEFGHRREADAWQNELDLRDWLAQHFNTLLDVGQTTQAAAIMVKHRNELRAFLGPKRLFLDNPAKSIDKPIEEEVIGSTSRSGLVSSLKSNHRKEGKSNV